MYYLNCFYIKNLKLFHFYINLCRLIFHSTKFYIFFKSTFLSTGHRNDPVVYPSGIISAFIGTEVNGGETTYHTTQLYRTYIDGTYTELLQSTSMVSPTPTLETAKRMESTTNMNEFGSLNSGKVLIV